jgi:hypothetical protein
VPAQDWRFNKKKPEAKTGIPTVGKKLKFSKIVPISYETLHPEVPIE